jgi:leucyl-tRNA synthetase
MLPYPSGRCTSAMSQLHAGRRRSPTSTAARLGHRAADGLRLLRPARENAALKEGEHPRRIVERNIVSIRQTMKRLGWAIDWSREFSTHEPEYYRWTQWLFLKFYEAGQAYRKAAIVNWCPNDQTVLANEQVVNGACERCGSEVEARKLEQWFFRITATPMSCSTR